MVGGLAILLTGTAYFCARSTAFYLLERFVDWLVGVAWRLDPPVFFYSDFFIYSYRGKGGVSLERTYCLSWGYLGDDLEQWVSCHDDHLVGAPSEAKAGAIRKETTIDKIGIETLCPLSQ